MRWIANGLIIVKLSVLPAYVTGGEWDCFWSCGSRTWREKLKHDTAPAPVRCKCCVLPWHRPALHLPWGSARVVPET